MSDVAMFKVLSARKSAMEERLMEERLLHGFCAGQNKTRLFLQGSDDSNSIFGAGAGPRMWRSGAFIINPLREREKSPLNVRANIFIPRFSDRSRISAADVAKHPHKTRV